MPVCQNGLQDRLTGSHTRARSMDSTDRHASFCFSIWLLASVKRTALSSHIYILLILLAIQHTPEYIVYIHCCINGGIQTNQTPFPKQPSAAQLHPLKKPRIFPLLFFPSSSLLFSSSYQFTLSIDSARLHFSPFSRERAPITLLAFCRAGLSGLFQLLELAILRCGD